MTYSAKRHTYAYSYTEAGKHAAGPHTGYGYEYEYGEGGKGEHFAFWKGRAARESGSKT